MAFCRSRGLAILERFLHSSGSKLHRGIVSSAHGNNRKTVGVYQHRAREHRCRRAANPENMRPILPGVVRKSVGRTEYQPSRYSEYRSSWGAVAQHILGSIPGNKMSLIFSKGMLRFFQSLRVPFRRCERFRITRQIIPSHLHHA